MFAATIIRITTLARNVLLTQCLLKMILRVFSLAFALPLFQRLAVQDLFGPAEILAMNHFTARAMSNRSSDPDLGTNAPNAYSVV